MKTQIQTEMVKTRLLRETPDGSICPECNRILPATIFERGGKVWIAKTCPEHGEYEELYYGSFEMYDKFSRFQHDGKGIKNPSMSLEKYNCPIDCGLCKSHLSHTALANLVVTNRCDLTCWYCFFYAKKGVEGAYVYEPTLEQICAMVKTLRAERPVPGNAIQLTGGEPTLRKDLVEIIKICRLDFTDGQAVASAALSTFNLLIDNGCYHRKIESIDGDSISRPQQDLHALVVCLGKKP